MTGTGGTLRAQARLQGSEPFSRFDQGGLAESCEVVGIAPLSF